jgi:hypothetical protein
MSSGARRPHLLPTQINQSARVAQPNFSKLGQVHQMLLYNESLASYEQPDGPNTNRYAQLIASVELLTKPIKTLRIVQPKMAGRNFSNFMWQLKVRQPK